MMSTPKNIGRATSRAERRTSANRSAAVSLPELVLFLRDVAEDVFHHHDRAIHDQAKSRLRRDSSDWR
jgi:hypothetical protein